jgi:hypothetical protein
MNTREIAAEYRLANWTQIMRRKKESGLSVKAFCENEGFHENIYYYWQRKLREATCEHMDKIQNEQVQVNLVPSGFAELKIVEAYKPPSFPENTTQGEIRIDIAGIRIAADSTYPSEKIAALLGLFKPPC